MRSEYSADVQIECNGAVRGSGCWRDIDWRRQTSCHLVNSIRTTNTATVRCWLVLWQQTLVISVESPVVRFDCGSLQSSAFQFILPEWKRFICISRNLHWHWLWIIQFVINIKNHKILTILRTLSIHLVNCFLLYFQLKLIYFKILYSVSLNNVYLGF